LKNPIFKNPSLRHTCLNNHKISPRPLDDSCIKHESCNGSFCMSFLLCLIFSTSAGRQSSKMHICKHPPWKH
jgi:hypothetical protein